MTFHIGGQPALFTDSAIPHSPVLLLLMMMMMMMMMMMAVMVMMVT